MYTYLIAELWYNFWCPNTNQPVLPEMKSNTKWESKYYQKNTISIIQVDKTEGYPKMIYTVPHLPVL